MLELEEVERLTLTAETMPQICADNVTRRKDRRSMTRRVLIFNSRLRPLNCHGWRNASAMMELLPEKETAPNFCG